MSDLRLHDYQEVARDFLRGQKRAALFLDMGLGKTAASLSALEPRHLPALVVAPKKVAEEVWDVEKDLWRPDLTMAVAAGGPAVRARQIASDVDVVVIGRDNLADILKVRRSRPFKTLIIDELSGYKGRGVRFKIAREIADDTEYVWGLTGTPSPNGLLDLWAPMCILDGGKRLEPYITHYRNRYFTAGRQTKDGTVIEYILKENAEQRIHEKIEDICLAMETDGRVHLPGVHINPIRLSLPKTSRDAYRKIANDLVVDLTEIFGGAIHSAANAAILTSKLSQIAAGFIYEDPVFEDTGEVDDDGLPVFVRTNEGAFTTLNHAKLDALAQIEEVATSPLLVGYRYVPEGQAILKRFPKAKSIHEKGVVKAWNRGEVPMLVAHPASAGHGLNLQHGGHTLVWTSLTWSLEEWDQFNKRLNRQGQKHPVVIHTLMAGTKSIDHLIAARLVDKAIVQDSLLDYLESPI